ncbi:MAG: GSCFA domain protein [Bacteroidales bacterium 45-6]|nr:MAG: GSCFA domain protein [Bacteroidales bacterium 45-6]
MNFRTQVDIPQSPLRMNHKQQHILLGSCFAENIGRLLLDNKFEIEMNPFGIVYNPMSAAKIINMLLDEYPFSEKDILHDKGLYFSLMHHGEFSESDPQAYLDKIRYSARRSASRVREMDNLLVTFGTAYTYSWKQTGQIVNNCHKLPASLFERKRLSFEEIVEEWSALIHRLLAIRPEMNFLFTVSPIRHWKDGAHENQLSKSILLLAIDELQRSFPSQVFYFPSYELILDELRDYRFYAEDMIHPNDTAIGYCWKKFSETYFDDETNRLIARWQPLFKAIAHRPFRLENAEHQVFLKKTLDKLWIFANDYPYLNCNKEIDQIKSYILE